MLSPEFDLAALGIGEERVVEARKEAGKSVELFVKHSPWEFYKKEAWQGWNAALNNWFVWKVITSAGVPLAMAIVGTLLGMGAAALLSYPHSFSFMWNLPSLRGPVCRGGQTF